MAKPTPKTRYDSDSTANTKNEYTGYEPSLGGSNDEDLCKKNAGGMICGRHGEGRRYTGRVRYAGATSGKDKAPGGETEGCWCERALGQSRVF